MGEALGGFSANAGKRRPLLLGRAYSSLVAEYLRSAPGFGRCFLELGRPRYRDSVTCGPGYQGRRPYGPGVEIGLPSVGDGSR